MRHRFGNAKLKRDVGARNSLFKNLTTSVIQEERVVTTVPKAKAVQPLVELLPGEEQHAVPDVLVDLGPGHLDLAPDDARGPLQRALEEVGRLEQRVGHPERVNQADEPLSAAAVGECQRPSTAVGMPVPGVVPGSFT